MTRSARALTLTDVLAEAVECVVTDRLADALSEVRFGRYSEAGAGWYWIAEFRREVGSHPSTTGTPVQPLRDRVRMTASAWEEARARYTEGRPG